MTSLLTKHAANVLIIAGILILLLFVYSLLIGEEDASTANISTRANPVPELSVLDSQSVFTELDGTQQDSLRNNTVGIVTGSVGGTYITIGNDLSNLLTDNVDYDLRVFNAVGRGSIGNIEDLLYQPGIDAAIVQADVLEYIRKDDEEGYEYLESRLRYITQIYNEEVHVLARAGIRSVDDLKGKTIAVGQRGGGTAVSAKTIFADYSVKLIYMHHKAAMAALLKEDIDAMMYVVGKPADVFTLPETESKRLGFVDFSGYQQPIDGGFDYSTSELTYDDYDHLVPKNKRVSVLAVPAILIVYNWKLRSGARSVSKSILLGKFINRFLDSIEELQDNTYSGKWCQMDISNDVDNWTRASSVTNWLNSRENNREPTKLSC